MKIVLSLIAKFLARPAVAGFLIRRAKRTPYFHITGPDGSVYMERYWLFNPYPANSSDANKKRFPISIRLHRIVRPDQDSHMHDHPWNARTFILRGGYTEVRPLYSDPDMREFAHLETALARTAGDTAALKFGEYHRITDVSNDGVWTLFVTGKYRGTWGFNVDGVKKPWREYLGIKE